MRDSITKLAEDTGKARWAWLFFAPRLHSDRLHSRLKYLATHRIRHWHPIYHLCHRPLHNCCSSSTASTDSELPRTSVAWDMGLPLLFGELWSFPTALTAQPVVRARPYCRVPLEHITAHSFVAAPAWRLLTWTMRYQRALQTDCVWDVQLFVNYVP